MLRYGAKIWGCHKGQDVEKKCIQTFVKGFKLSEKIHASVRYIMSWVDFH